jgi:hypothetical protein
MANQGIVEDLSSIIQNPKIGDEFDSYKQTEEYTNYFDSIKIENEGMSDYLINLAIFGYWYELNHGKIEEAKEKVLYPAPKGDLKGLVGVYDSFDEYLQKNPDVKVLGEDIKLISEVNDFTNKKLD